MKYYFMRSSYLRFEYVLPNGTAIERTYNLENWAEVCQLPVLEERHQAKKQMLDEAVKVFMQDIDPNIPKSMLGIKFNGKAFVSIMIQEVPDKPVIAPAAKKLRVHVISGSDSERITSLTTELEKTNEKLKKFKAYCRELGKQNENLINKLKKTEVNG